MASTVFRAFWFVENYQVLALKKGPGETPAPTRGTRVLPPETQKPRQSLVSRALTSAAI
jgi:hypothetical protein